MRQASWTRRVVVVVALVGLVAAGLALRAQQGADSSSLPACIDLAGTRLGPLGEDPAWNGCLTSAGAAVQSYRYECSRLRAVRPPDGDEDPLADDAAVVVLPDARLVAAVGQEWIQSRHPAYPAGTYPDRDIGKFWEQWSIDVPGATGREDPHVLLSGPDGQWRMTVPERHRDARCSTHPDAWDQAWRSGAGDGEVS